MHISARVGLTQFAKMRLATLFLFFTTLVLGHSQDEPCTPPSGQPSCVCDTENGIIDLTSMSYKDGNPYFAEWDMNGNQFFYNPCRSFDAAFPDCTGDTAVCQDYNSGEAKCGAASTEQIVKRGNDYYVLYSGGTDGRSAEVKLICDPLAEIPTFQPYGDVTVQLKYEFDLTTKCACPGTCVGATAPPDPDDPGGGGSKPSKTPAGAIGIVFMFLIPAVFATYFIVGAIILKYRFEKTGTDIIPQKEFWFTLPFLVKDGVLFTFTPIIQLVKKDKGTSYDNI